MRGSGRVSPRAGAVLLLLRGRAVGLIRCHHQADSSGCPGRVDQRREIRHSGCRPVAIYPSGPANLAGGDRTERLAFRGISRRKRSALLYTTVNRCAFITSMNVIFVPLIAAIFGRRIRPGYLGRRHNRAHRLQSALPRRFGAEYRRFLDASHGHHLGRLYSAA